MLQSVQFVKRTPGVVGGLDQIVLDAPARFDGRPLVADEHAGETDVVDPVALDRAEVGCVIEGGDAVTLELVGSGVIADFKALDLDAVGGDLETVQSGSGPVQNGPALGRGLSSPPSG